MEKIKRFCTNYQQDLFDIFENSHLFMHFVPRVNNFQDPRRCCLFVIVFLFPLIVTSQTDSTVIRKFSPLAFEAAKMNNPGQVNEFIVSVNNIASFRNFIEHSPGIVLVYEYPLSGIFRIRTTWRWINEIIVKKQEVIFIDFKRSPKEEVAISNLDLSTNKVNLLHNRLPLYNGLNTTVSIKENRPDTSDIDMKGRYIHTPLTSAIQSSHATFMSTITTGAGNSYYEGKGVATGANITSANFNNLLPDPDAYYNQYSISVQNHSYGTGIENYYGADAMAFDMSVTLRSSLLHVFSAGNDGPETSIAGNYSGIPGFANITGSYKMAKNIITVGHTDSLGAVLPASSKGPAYDGRLKPELVAFGEDGSSGAAAIVSGIALTLQQAWKEMNGSLPSSSLIKASLLNSAEDTGPKGIDFNSGYGTVNAAKAMETLVQAHFATGSVTNGNNNTHLLTVPPSIKQLKVMLVWNDPAASANAVKALRNDLDLELSFPTTGEKWQPWVLSQFPRVDSLRLLPTRKRDSLNNAEQITIDNPAAGTYQVIVKGYSVTASSPQNYSIAYQFDTLDKFSWQYPSSTDNIFGGSQNIIRWSSGFNATIAQLDYSLNNGSTWQSISNSIDLSKGYFKWNAPDTFAQASVRMSFAARSFVSDPFTISKRVQTFVGFNCPDSFLFYWQKQKGVSQYQVYRLGTKYLEPLLFTADTAVLLAKASNPSRVYAIAPVLNGKTGVRSFAFDYTQQGVGCYIKSFLAVGSGNNVVLNLVLGTNYKISFVSWGRVIDNVFSVVHATTNNQLLSFVFTDNYPAYGINRYQVKIGLTDGQVIYSTIETVYFFGTRHYILFPNPSRQNEAVNVITTEAPLTRMQVFNSAGIRIYEKRLTDLVNVIPAGKLSAGIYFVRMVKDNNEMETLKLVVY